MVAVLVKAGRELLWLLIAAIASFLLAVYFTNWRFDSKITFQFYDTYYVVAFWMIILPLFSFFSFLLFIAKEIRNRFRKTLPSVILIGTGILSIAMLSVIMKFTPVISGYTLYPPLSALGDDWINVGYDKEMMVLATIIISVQVIVGVISAYVAYRLGTALRKPA